MKSGIHEFAISLLHDFTLKNEIVNSRIHYFILSFIQVFLKRNRKIMKSRIHEFAISSFHDFTLKNEIVNSWFHDFIISFIQFLKKEIKEKFINSLLKYWNIKILKSWIRKREMSPQVFRNIYMLLFASF
jgi:hypothetical protein